MDDEARSAAAAMAVDNTAAPPDETGPRNPAFDCPRCGSRVLEAFYGPCGTCRDALRATITADAADIVAADYEPKMNVTPNAVALKE